MHIGRASISNFIQTHKFSCFYKAELSHVNVFNEIDTEDVQRFVMFAVLSFASIHKSLVLVYLNYFSCCHSHYFHYVESSSNEKSNVSIVYKLEQRQTEILSCGWWIWFHLAPSFRNGAQIWIKNSNTYANALSILHRDMKACIFFITRNSCKYVLLSHSNELVPNPNITQRTVTHKKAREKNIRSTSDDRKFIQRTSSFHMHVDIFSCISSVMSKSRFDVFCIRNIKNAKSQPSAHRTVAMVLYLFYYIHIILLSDHLSMSCNCIIHKVFMSDWLLEPHSTISIHRISNHVIFTH